MASESDAGGPVAITLAETLDLCAAAPLAAVLLALRGQDAAVDASEVRRLGGQCLQVLLSARQTWAFDGHALTFFNPSPEFLDGMALLGAPIADLVSTH